MIKDSEFQQIKKTIFDVLNFNYTGEIIPVASDCVYVKNEGNKAYIGAGDKSFCARSFMLLAQNADKETEIKQSAKFASRDVMIDVSRGGAMRVSALKKYMDYMACFGFNSLWLYMEDMYELKEYPHFGYMRGRYSAEELKDLDNYAYSLGIELIPCIQTLSHFGEYLRWDEAAQIRATGSTILCDEEKTYEFIETIIKTMKNIFRTNRIHIGMDEAFDFTGGEYEKRHGKANEFDVFTRHLNRVVEICKKYDLKPMIWDDMFFRIGSETKDYYDINAKIPQEVKDKIPDVDLVYWDYDRITEEKYIQLMECHKSMGKKVIYAGGMWTWTTGPLVDTYNVFATLWNGVNSAAKCQINEVVATIWGDDCTECNYFMSLPYLALMSEPCFNYGCTKEDAMRVAEFVTGVNFDAMHALSAYNQPRKEENGGIKFAGRGKRIFYADILVNQTGQIKKLADYTERYKKSCEILKNAAQNSNDMWTNFYIYAAEIFEFLATKAEVMGEIRNKYAKKDMQYFENLSDNVMPALIVLAEEIYNKLYKNWEITYKAFGFERISKRYVICIDRLKYAHRAIKAFAEGKADNIELLDCDYIEEELESLRIVTGGYLL